MFQLRLHPTSSNLVIGLAVIALWAVLWIWVLAQFAVAPRPVARATVVLPEVASVEVAPAVHFSR